MAPPTKYRVLVVDDNRDAAVTMSELLASAGFEVETHFDGASALAAAGPAAPDACVLDIAMPEMDGYELAQKLRERYPDRPPLFATMTAYEDYAHLEKAVGAGFDLQFTKPADPRDVIEQLREGIRDGRTFTETHAAEVGTTGDADRHSALHRLFSKLTGLWS